MTTSRPVPGNAACAEVAPPPDVWRERTCGGHGIPAERIGELVTHALPPLGACCPVSQPIAAAVAALSPSAGFVRDGVPAMVLFVTASDDASSSMEGAPLDAATAAKALVARRGSALASAIVNVGGAACRADLGMPPARLKGFIEEFGNNGALTAGCDDWRLAFRLVAVLLDGHCYGAIDSIPSPGFDITAVDWARDCVVDEVPADGPPRSLPVCGTAAAPCWRVEVPSEANGACQIRPDGKQFVIDRGGCVPPPGTTARMRCRVAPPAP